MILKFFWFYFCSCITSNDINKYRKNIVLFHIEFGDNDSAGSINKP